MSNDVLTMVIICEICLGMKKDMALPSKSLVKTREMHRCSHRTEQASILVPSFFLPSFFSSISRHPQI